ncbi:MAG: matrixin family metalloprotease [Spirochaetia bacterium]|nr:matrixin family metalloprotease [Spirochaetia bacterium]
MKRAWLTISVILLLFSTPLFAWYYFTTAGGLRQQWVFGTSCNTSGSRPITMIYDADLPGTFQAAIAPVIVQWNTPTGGNLLCPVGTCAPTNPTYQRTMDATAVSNFVSSPTSNQIWLVWDSDGSVLRSVGIDPTSGVLGIGVGLDANSSRPQDLCAGVLLLNGTSISTTTRFQQVSIHEIGHVLGLAHSIAGNNMGTVTAQSAGCSGVACLPVMFPFLFSNSSTTLNPDDLAGARSIYAP